MKRYFSMQRMALLFCWLALGAAHAEPVHQGTLLLDGAYARATVPGQEVGAAYLTIENTGAAADRLMGASSSVARSVVLHSSQMDQGMARMHHEASLEIPAHGRVEMMPGGLHLMLEDLKKPLREGETLRMKLKFEHAGEVDIAVPVKPLLPEGGMGTMHHDSMHHDSMH